MQGIYDHIDEISGSTQKKLIEGKDSALMSYSLAKIMVDAPVDLDKIPDLVIEPKRIIAALKKLEFRSLIRKFMAEFEINGSEETSKTEDLVEQFPIPEGMLVMADIKEKMHASKELTEVILSNKREFFDTKQAEFLLNPLKREENEVQQESLLVAEDCDKALRGEYSEAWRIKYAKLVGELKKQPKLWGILTKFDLPLIPVLYKMEKCGVKIDLGYFAQLKKEFTDRVNVLEQKIYTATGIKFNVNSPVQLSKVLFEDLDLSVKGIKKTTRGYSTGASELEKLEGTHPVIGLIKEYREVAKLLSTYVLPLPELVEDDGRVHTTFTQDVTATGRLSSVNPNLQNIPVRSEDGKRIRTGFVAKQGRILVSENVDIHTKTASEVFGIPMEQVTKSQRRAAKIINFGVMYGMSPKGLADAADMNFMEAKQFIDDYFKVRQPIKNYLDKTLEQARNLGYVETFFGRKRPTPDVKSANYIVRTAAERAAQNMPIQGTEADLMKRAMIQVDQMLSNKFIGKANLVLQIHDSLIIECDLTINGVGEDYGKCGAGTSSATKS